MAHFIGFVLTPDDDDDDDNSDVLNSILHDMLIEFCCSALST